MTDTMQQVLEDYSMDPGIAHLRSIGEYPWWDVRGCLRNPKVCFIQEAPQRGQRWWAIFDELLEGVGLRREEVYVTAVVKYHVDAHPTAHEWAVSRPYLWRELKVVDPQVLVPFGAASRAVLTECPPVSVAHGLRFMRRRGQPLIPVYHPAIAMYQPKAMEMLRQDFAAIAKEFAEGFE